MELRVSHLSCGQTKFAGEKSWGSWYEVNAVPIGRTDGIVQRVRIPVGQRDKRVLFAYFGVREDAE
ncbi:hypothetical protein FQZ97_885880 [compost metagenome]